MAERDPSSDIMSEVRTSGPGTIDVTGAVSPDAPLVDGPQRDLLCALSHVYLACGEPGRALSLLQLVATERPEDVEVLRALAYGRIMVGDGAEALDLLDRLDALDLDSASRTPLLLMRSHALRLIGRWIEARACFARFVVARHEHTP